MGYWLKPYVDVPCVCAVAGYAMHRMFHPKEEPLDMEKLSEAGYGANYFKTRGERTGSPLPPHVIPLTALSLLFC